MNVKVCCNISGKQKIKETKVNDSSENLLSHDVIVF